MQSSSSDRPFKPDLAGASPATDTNNHQGRGVIAATLSWWPSAKTPVRIPPPDQRKQRGERSSR